MKDGERTLDMRIALRPLLQSLCGVRDLCHGSLGPTFAGIASMCPLVVCGVPWVHKDRRLGVSRVCRDSRFPADCRKGAS